MSVCIVDACVVAKWVFEEEHTPEALTLLENNTTLHAPDFLLLEMDNIVGKRIRRDQITLKEGEKVRAALRQFPVQLHSFLTLLDPAYQIACQTGRSVYDCLYLALAMLLRGKMVTADQRFYSGLQQGAFAKHVLWIEQVTH